MHAAHLFQCFSTTRFPTTNTCHMQDTKASNECANCYAPFLPVEYPHKVGTAVLSLPLASASSTCLGQHLLGRFQLNQRSILVAAGVYAISHCFVVTSLVKGECLMQCTVQLGEQFCRMMMMDNTCSTIGCCSYSGLPYCRSSQLAHNTASHIAM